MGIITGDTRVGRRHPRGLSPLPAKASLHVFSDTGEGGMHEENHGSVAAEDKNEN